MGSAGDRTGDRTEAGRRSATGESSGIHPIVKIDIDEVIREHFERIHRAALVLTGNPWDADDLTQETFLVLTRQPDRFRGESAIYTWLYGILVNLERRRRRQCATRQKGLRIVSERMDEAAPTAPPAGERVVVDEWRSSLWSRVAELSDGQRHAIVLRFSEGLSYDEIARVLDCPLGTVKSRIFHGLANLKRLIEGTPGMHPGDMPRHLSEMVEPGEDVLRLRTEARGG